MKKYRVFQLATIIVVFLMIGSCSKDNNEAVDDLPTTITKALNIPEGESYKSAYHNGISIFYYYNKLSGKVKFCCYDEANHKLSNVVESKISCPYEKDAGYGEKTYATFGSLNFFDKNDGFMCYFPLGYNYKNSSFYADFNFYIFYKNGVVSLIDKECRLSTEIPRGIEPFMSWFDNSIFINTYNQCLIVVSDNGYSSFSWINDEETYIAFCHIPCYFYPISLKEGIIIRSWNNEEYFVSRFVLNEFVSLKWKNKLNIDTTSDPKIEFQFGSFDGTFLEIIINKTEYNGSKSQIKFKLNVNTGESEEIG